MTGKGKFEVKFPEPTPTPIVTGGGMQYVVNSASGNDSNPGTALAPLKTIKKVNSLLYPGDKAILRGVFNNDPIAPARSGTQSAPITYMPDPAGATCDGVGPSTMPYCLYLNKSWIVVDGSPNNGATKNVLKIKNSNYVNAPVANKGIVLRNAMDCTLKNFETDYMQMQLIGACRNKLLYLKTREFVAKYISGAAYTAGDVLNLVLGSHDNEIAHMDMKYGGHSLIQIGSGIGNGEQNLRNWIHHNDLDNPWYDVMQLSGDGTGTIIEYNNMLNTCSVPYLLSTVVGKVGMLVKSAIGLQFSGMGFTVRYNVLDNMTAEYGVISLGARWYVDSFRPNGVLIESLDNDIYENTIQNCKGASVFSLIPFLLASDITAGRTAIPQVTRNKMHHNHIRNFAGSVDSINKNLNFATVNYHTATEEPLWIGLNGNEFHDNDGCDSAHAYRADGVYGPGQHNLFQQKTLAQFNGLDANVYNNVV